MSTFKEKMSQGIENEMENQFQKGRALTAQAQEDAAKIQQLIDTCNSLTVDIKVKVPTLKDSDISIDKNNLRQEMERTMVLHSYIIDDIYQMKCLVQKMKVLLNSLVGIIHHNLKFKNQLRLKSAKEMETYIAQEPSYNIININIQNVNNIIDRSTDHSGLIKQKIGFIRDLIKMRTQELFSEK
jgi:hypothetical protein